MVAPQGATISLGQILERLGLKHRFRCYYRVASDLAHLRKIDSDPHHGRYTEGQLSSSRPSHKPYVIWVTYW